MSSSDTSDLTSLVSITDLPEDVGFSTFFWHFFKKGRFTDVELNLETPDGTVTFSAHKMILSMRSPFFADMFYGEQGDAEAAVNIVTLQKVDSEAFENMLRYMYGYTPTLETPKQAFNLYKVAAKFQVNSLMDLCRHFLSRFEVEPSNIFIILEVAESMQNKSLRDRCLKLLQERTREVMESYKLHEITPSMIHVILDLPELSFESEYELLQWLFKWSGERCQKNSEYTNIREVLEKFLPDMHFLSLTNTEFAMLYRDHEDFFTQDEIMSIFMNIAIPGSRPMPDWYDKECPSRVYARSRE